MAAAISLLSLVTSPSLTLITCHTTALCSIRTLSPPLLPLSLPQNLNQIPLPISSCALHCPHFQSCSGCTHEYNLHHPPILNEAIDFFKNIGVSDFTFDSCRLWGWRCRAKLAIRGSSIKPLIGLYEECTHNVVNIPECKALIFAAAIAAGYRLGSRFGGFCNAGLGGAVVLGAAGAGAAFAVNSQ